MRAIGSEIEDIAEAIWETLFDLPIGRGGEEGVGHEPQVTGLVHIDGAFHGAVMVQCPESLGSTLTAAMFQGDTRPTNDEIRDALGELTNMFAGNVKALLPEPSSISLPAVAFGSDYEIAVVGTIVVARVPFVCGGLPLVVTLLERSGHRETQR